MDIAEVIAERMIREAMEQGKFDNLPGHGKPIANLDRQLEPGWWAKRCIEAERERARDADAG